MALVSQGFFLAITLEDNQGDKSTVQYGMQAADYATAIIAANGAVSDIQDMTKSSVQSYAVSERFIDDAFVFPVSGNNSEKLSMTIDLATPGKRANSRIPAPEDAIFVDTSGPNANVLDTTNAAVIQWQSVLVNSLTISDGEIPLSILSGRRT